MVGIWIMLSNALSGELNRDFVPFNDQDGVDGFLFQLELGNHVRKLMSNGIHSGDTITFIEGTSEQ